jgi:hypothetical protein
MKKLFLTIFCLIVFPIISGALVLAEPIYFIHVETGYILTPSQICLGKHSSNDLGSYCLPDPQYSNPANDPMLDKIENSIKPDIENSSLEEIADHLYERGARAIFLVTPYYAEHHPDAVNYVLGKGFNISVHIHEDWESLSKASAAKIDEYISSEKTRLENVAGREITFFSYGPGIEMTDSTNISKIFKGIADAGFKEVQTIPPYDSYATQWGLIPAHNCPETRDNVFLKDCLLGLPHSWEVHTSSEVNRTGMDVLKKRIDNCVKGMNETGYCDLSCGASDECSNKNSGSAWCNAGITKFWCSSDCKVNKKDCTDYGTNYHCSYGECIPPGKWMTIKAGWNMISLSAGSTLTADSIKASCGPGARIWHYDSYSKIFGEVTKAEPGLGYWVRSSYDCSVQLTGNDIQSIPGLKAGWNQIGSFSQTVIFNNVKGNCNVLSGPWKYLSGRYEIATSLEPGYAYWIRTSNDCSLKK